MTATDVDPTTSGPDLISKLAETLGIAIVVHDVDVADDGATSIEASFLTSLARTTVSVQAGSEAEAWKELGAAAISWRTSDQEHITMWPGGG